MLTSSDAADAPSRTRRILVVVLGAVGVALILVGGATAARHLGGESPTADRISTEAARTYGVEPVTRMELAPAKADPAMGVPTRVWVPRLAVDVPVIPIAPTGRVLVPPANPAELGWYQYGARPGAVSGSAVITGHTVHTGGGALDDLADLQHGDSVFVRTAKGRIGYSVTNVTKLTKQQFAGRAEQLFSGSVPGRLVLITCTNWNGREYLANTVVFAEPISKG